MEIVSQERNNTRIIGGFVKVLDGVQHRHARPPVEVIPGRAEGAAGLLAADGPVDPFLQFVDEVRIVQGIGERDQAFDVIRWALPV